MLLAGNITSEEAPTQRTQMELWPEEKRTDLKKLRKSKAVSSEKPTVQMGDIHEASRKGDAVAVKRILYQDPAAIHAKDSDGNMPLSYAAEEGHADVAEVLLSHGAEVDARIQFHGQQMDGVALFATRRHGHPPGGSFHW